MAESFNFILRLQRALPLQVAIMLVLISPYSMAELPLVFQTNPEFKYHHSLAMKVLLPAYQRAGLGIKPSRKSGIRYDGVLIGRRNPELIQQGYRPIPVVIGYAKLQAYVSKQHQDVTFEYGMLQSNRVSVVSGSQLAEQMMAGQVVYPARNASLAFERLSNRSVDVVLMTELEARLAAPKSSHQGVGLLPVVQEIPLYHYVHKRHANTIRKITHHLQTMKAQHQIAHINAGYRQQFLNASQWANVGKVAHPVMIQPPRDWGSI